jgi:hypothetical protein
MAEDRDLYERFYAERLWTLLPEVYRVSDRDTPESVPGPLRELVERIAAEIAIVRRSIDRTVEDQSIETADDWLIPYLGDLVATRLVDGLDGRAQRLDVAKTIYYRRRKGTVGLLEELTADITGWNARVVEFFRRLTRTRHSFDPPLGHDRQQALVAGLEGALSRSPAGGFADLRHAGAALKSRTAFDEFSHTADFRAGRSETGWHGIAKLGVFVWRLRSFELRQTTPVADPTCARRFTFDPTGRDVSLFVRDERDPAQYGDAWVAPDEWMLPGRMTAELFKRESRRLYPASVSVRDEFPTGEVPVAQDQVTIEPERGRFLARADTPAGATRLVTYCAGFSSEIGAGPYDRRTLKLAPLEQSVPVVRVAGGATALTAAAVTGALGNPATGTISIGDSRTYTSVPSPWTVQKATLTAEPGERPVLRLSGGQWIINGSGNAELVLEGILLSGCDIVLAGAFESVTISCASLDPGETVGPDGTLPTAIDGRPLRGSTIWVEGIVSKLVLRRSICGPIRVRKSGVIGAIETTDTIIQAVRPSLPGALDATSVLDPRSFVRRLRNANDPLAVVLLSALPAALKASVVAHDVATDPPPAMITDVTAALTTYITANPVYTPAAFAAVAMPPGLRRQAVAGAPAGANLRRLNRLLLEAAFPRALQPAAIIAPSGNLSLTRTSVLGAVNARHIAASETILRGTAVAEDRQAACVRFSAYEDGSQLHQPYESVTLRENAPVFSSERFAQPDYAQLAALCDREVITPSGGSVFSGAQNGSEMGAFSIEKNALKERGLRLKLEEYMPIGLTPVVVKVT